MGIALGNMVHIVIAIVGISAIIAPSATLSSLVKSIDAGYLRKRDAAFDRKLAAADPFGPKKSRPRLAAQAEDTHT